MERNRAQSCLVMYTKYPFESIIMKNILTLFLLAITLGCSATAQTMAHPPQPATISISMSATELVPADQIIFNITINAEEETPRMAFNKHKEMESLLASLLQKMNIDKKNIQFQPVRINKSYRNNREDKFSQTNQQVSVSFSDFALYEELQITLIENGFDTFNANFSSSEIAEGKEEALISAIESAREKALLIAKTSGVSLGDVKSINYGDYTVQPYPAARGLMMEMDMAKAPSLMDFDQTVSVTANISIEYFIAK